MMTHLDPKALNDLIIAAGVVYSKLVSEYGYVSILDQKALGQALKALEPMLPLAAIPPSEPVAWRNKVSGDVITTDPRSNPEWTGLYDPLYTHPPTVTTEKDSGKWITVPRKPTPEMISAGKEHIGHLGESLLDAGDDWIGDPDRVYRAMLKASPAYVPLCGEPER